MGRLLTLLAAYVLVLSLGIGSVAHAVEPIGCIDPAVELSIGHAAGDTDQSTDDSGKAAPHHHGGCHGHHVSTAADTAVSTIYFSANDCLTPHSFAGLPGGGAGPALRPPIA